VVVLVKGVCGPLTSPARENASAALKNFVRQPEKDFFQHYRYKADLIGRAVDVGLSG